MINIISSVALILLIAFRTDAWLEYCRLFKLNSISWYKDFDEKYKEDVSLTYFIYLRRYHNCFLIRLVTCPICFAVWIGIHFGIITFTLESISIYIIGGLFVYGVINKLLD